MNQKHKPRIHFFYGTDNYFSLQKLLNWQELFSEKHGSDATQIFDVDEMSGQDFSDNLDAVLQSQSLFASAQFIVFKRITNQDKGRKKIYSELLIQKIEQSKSSIPPETTIVFWEDQGLDPDHLLVLRFKEWEKSGEAKVYLIDLPVARQLQDYIATVAKVNNKLVSEAGVRWITQQWNLLEAEVRNERKLKKQQAWNDDFRGWWLNSLLNIAGLQSSENVITEVELQIASESVSLVTPFDFADALISRNRSKLFEYLTKISQEKATYFYGLYGVLQWKLTQKNDPLLQNYLAQIDIIGKNFSVDHNWLLHLLVLSVLSDIPEKELLSFKLLWLADLART